MVRLVQVTDNQNTRKHRALARVLVVDRCRARGYRVDSCAPREPHAAPDAAPRGPHSESLLTQLAQGVALVAARFLELQPAVGATTAQPEAWASAARDIAVQAGASATFAQRVRGAEGAATPAPWPHRDSHERTAPSGVAPGAEAAVANAASANAAIREDMYPHRAVLGMAPPYESFAVAPQIERPSAHLAASAAAADDRPTVPPASNRAADTRNAHASAESMQERTRAAAPAPSSTPAPSALPAHDAGAKPPSVEGVQRPSPPLERRSSRVPVSTMERMARFTGLGLSIAAGTVSSLVGNTLRGTYAASGGLKGSVLSEANSERLTLVLCRMRGAALKFGQLLSIQVATRMFIFMLCIMFYRMFIFISCIIYQVATRMCIFVLCVIFYCMLVLYMHVHYSCT
jgi:hypothetical protein